MIYNAVLESNRQFKENRGTAYCYSLRPIKLMSKDKASNPKKILDFYKPVLLLKQSKKMM